MLSPMKNRDAFITGILIAAVGFAGRLCLSSIFTRFTYGADAALSLQAWADLLLVVMQAGAALMLIGWFCPKRSSDGE